MIGDSSGSPATPKALLCNLPLTLKITVTVFLVLLAVGLAVSVGHTYGSYADADGHPSLTLQDLRVALAGERPPRGNVPTVEQTMMWEEIHGAMRKYFTRDIDLEILAAWLRAGAEEVTYDWPWTTVDDGLRPAPSPIPPPGEAPVAQPSFRRAPAEIMRDQCASCHNPGGERPNSPLTGYAQVARFTVLPQAPVVQIPDVARQISVLHAHLLTIPVVALLVAVLFHLADWPPGSPAGRTVMTMLPILCIAGDVAMTWLSRAAVGLVYPALAFRGLFLLVIAVQIVGALGGIWQRAHQAGSDPTDT